jgi:hypothetical protein
MTSHIFKYRRPYKLDGTPEHDTHDGERVQLIGPARNRAMLLVECADGTRLSVYAFELEEIPAEHEPPWTPEATQRLESSQIQETTPAEVFRQLLPELPRLLVASQHAMTNPRSPDGHVAWVKVHTHLHRLQQSIHDALQSEKLDDALEGVGPDE